MRKRLCFSYQGRHRNEVTQREVSLQRLSHYRENWYSTPGATTSRRCASSRSTPCASRSSEEVAHEIPLDELKLQLAGGYGIYFGGPPRLARLRFNAAAARWSGTSAGIRSKVA